MKIGIIGSGMVGSVLATAFLKEGYEVMLGTRDITKKEVVSWKSTNPGGHTGTFKDAASFAELIVFAVHGKAAEEVIELSGKENFTDKIVIDTTNPLSEEAPVNGVLRVFNDPNESLLEKIQGLLPGAHIVKAFNSVGSSQMYKPDYNGIIPTMFICGNNEGAKKTTTEILARFGWETEDMGLQEAARAIEPLSVLWCIPGFLHNRWTHAFKLLKIKS